MITFTLHVAGGRVTPAIPLRLRERQASRGATAEDTAVKERCGPPPRGDSLALSFVAMLAAADLAGGVVHLVLVPRSARDFDDSI
ncbi:MAG TPA: hypothetical protein VIX15_13605 [Streptosporangiaceae bacterium]